MYRDAKITIDPVNTFSFLPDDKGSLLVPSSPDKINEECVNIGT